MRGIALIDMGDFARPRSLPELVRSANPAAGILRATMEGYGNDYQTSYVHPVHDAGRSTRGSGRLEP